MTKQQEPEMAVKRYWMGHVGLKDDFNDPIEKIFYDGKTLMGPWAIMTPQSWRKVGCMRTGTGYAQKYEKQSDGRWLKVEG